MREHFKNINFKPRSLDLITQCNAIIRDYKSQGLRMTLRQLYYQLVTKNIIPNQKTSYNNLSALLNDARYAGMVDWAAIEDRGRQPRSPQEFANLAELVETAIDAYRLPRWRGQKHYVELWVEKEALAGVLQPLASEYHVTLMVNKGYSSASAMYASAKRFLSCFDTLKENWTPEQAEEYDQGGYYNSDDHLSLLYLGDHDPSGEDMVRDIRDRLRTFEAYVDVQKIALTMDQVEEYRPPPNYAKVTDSRAAKYIEKYGEHSWEVDALPPNTLADIIRDSFESILDQSKMDQVINQEETDKIALREAVKSISNPQKTGEATDT
jgi:hypothetical protein